MNSLIKIYNTVFNYIAKNRIKKNDLNLSIIHTHNLVVFSTSALMWCYATIAYYSISSPIPFYVGFSSSIIHLLSPILYRWTKNHLFITSFMLAAGVAHQGTFVYFTGGFSSHILIWFGLIPMLAGVISGKKAIKLWCFLVTLIALTYFIMKIFNYQCPNLISETGLLISHSLLVFGWIFVGSIIIFTYTILIEQSNKKLDAKKTKIEFLLRVILHDMSNSIQVIRSYAMLLMTKTDTESPNLKKYESIGKHSSFLAETISSVKSMYMLDNTNNDIQLTNVDINRSIRLISSIIETKLEEKNMTLNYNYEQNENTFARLSPHIFENQILQNILTNAIKFSHPGSNIDISLAESTTCPETLFLKIKDYGIGMPPEIRDNLFDSQKITSRRGTNKEPGTGLGMHILKNFIEKMDGSVSVESTPNIGTEFSLKLKRGVVPNSQ